MTPPRYFGGSGDDLGNVSLLSATSFGELVKETLGHPIITNVTRAQFAAMDKKARSAVKRVPYVVPCSFPGEQSPRFHANAQPCYLIALDLDDSTQAMPFYQHPQRLVEALEPFACAMYSTASSTPEAPRVRVLVAADGIPVADYGRAVGFVAARLGLLTVNRESLVAVQPMYLPTLFRGDDQVLQHPLMVAVTEGESITPGDIADAPATSSAKAPPRSPNGSYGDDLEFLRTPVEGVTLDDLSDALMHLDPDCAYNEWLDIAAALRHQFPREPDSHGAYELFDTWSRKGRKYAGAEDTLAKWNSLKPSPRGRRPVTARSLMQRASDAGWLTTKVASRCYAALMAWISHKDRTPHDLMADAVRRIAAAPMLSPLERSTLMARLQEQLAHHKLRVSQKDLRFELRSLERAARAPSATHTESNAIPENQLPPWARGMVYVAGTNEFYQRAGDRAFKPEVLDNMFNQHLIQPGENKNGRPETSAKDYLLNVARIPRVDDFRYDPTQPGEVFLRDGKRRYINTFVQTHPEPDWGKADEAGTIFLEHINRLIAEPEHRALLIDFLAFQVQSPGSKVRWAVLIQGAQGCGKTAIADAMGVVLGRNNVKVVDASTLLSNTYNDWATGAQLVVMEEIRVVGTNRHEIMNRLKPVITNETIAINRKYKELRQVPNTSNYVMFTNHHDAVALQDGERRYFVLRSALQTRAQVMALGPDYFRRFYGMLRDNGAGLRAWLEQWTFSALFNPNGHAPVTTHLTDMIHTTASPLHAAIVQTLEEQDHPLVRRDMVSTRSLRSMLEANRIVGFSDQALGSILREIGYIQAGRFRLQGDRHYVWVLQELSWTTEMTTEAWETRSQMAENSDFNMLD